MLAAVSCRLRFPVLLGGFSLVLGRSVENRCSCATVLAAMRISRNAWSRQVQQCASRRPVKTLASLDVGGAQAIILAHRKSHLPRHMSRRVEKPPAWGPFGFGASVLHAASPRCAALCFTAPLRGLETVLSRRSGPQLTRIGTFEHWGQRFAGSRTSSQEQSSALRESVGYGARCTQAAGDNTPQFTAAPGVT